MQEDSLTNRLSSFCSSIQSFLSIYQAQLYRTARTDRIIRRSQRFQRIIITSEPY